jgi:hypothetical protein
MHGCAWLLQIEILGTFCPHPWLAVELAGGGIREADRSSLFFSFHVVFFPFLPVTRRSFIGGETL